MEKPLTENHKECTSKKFSDLSPQIVVYHIFEYYQSTVAILENNDNWNFLFGYFKNDKLRNIWFLFSSLVFIKFDSGKFLINPIRLKRVKIEMNHFAEIRSAILHPKNNIKTLNLYHSWKKNKFFKPDFFTILENHEKIETLRVGLNKFTDYSITFKPKKFPNLKLFNLDVGKNMVSDEFIKINGSKLEKIILYDSEMKGNWGTLPKLKSISISSCTNYKDSIFKDQEFSKLSKLRIRNSLREIDLQSWKPIKTLKVLELSNCKTMNFFNCLHEFENLEDLIIEPTFDELKYQNHFFKNLKKLKIKINGENQNAFFKNNQFPVLEDFHIICEEFNLENYFFLLDKKKTSKLQCIKIEFLEEEEFNYDRRSRIFTLYFPYSQKNKHDKNLKKFAISKLDLLNIKTEHCKRKIEIRGIEEIIIYKRNSLHIEKFFEIFKFPEVNTLVFENEDQLGTPKIVQNFEKLDRIDINGNLKDDFFRINKFNQITKMKILHLVTNLKGKKWEEMTNLKELEINMFKDTSLGNELFSTNYFPNLKSLSMSNWSRKIGKNWKIIPKLKEMIATDVNLSDEPFRGILRFPNLEKLEYKITTLDEDENEAIERFKNFFLREKWMIFPKLKEIVLEKP